MRFVMSTEVKRSKGNCGCGHPGSLIPAHVCLDPKQLSIPKTIIGVTQTVFYSL